MLSNNPIETKHPKIFRSQEPFIELSKLEEEIDYLKVLILENNLEEIYDKFKKIVVEYSPSNKIIDHTFKKNNN